MARVTSTTTRRRIWLPVVLVILFTLWYRRQYSVTKVQPRPKWDVVDFQIKEHKSNQDAYVDDAEPEGIRHRHGHEHIQHDYQAQIDAIRDKPAFQQQQLSYDALQDKIQQFIQWDRPSTDHWPAWHDYDNADYDPNRWEALDRYACIS